MFSLECATQQKDVTFDAVWREAAQDIYEAAITLESRTPCVFQPVKISFLIPSIEVHYIWTPKIDLIRALNPSWYANLYTSNAFTGAPVNSLMRYDDKNICTWAFSDTFETAVMRSWALEESGMYECSIKLFEKGGAARKNYSAVLRLDMRSVRYDRALEDVQLWWCEGAPNAPLTVPDAARHAMYSTWYSYHQKLHTEALLSECREAKKLGCGAIIIDDGWQTADGSRGYAYCGDWHLCREKIADMHGFCEAVHALGMKVMLWYSVPYIGIKSQKYNIFKDKVIAFITDEWAVLDTRYPDVREFLISTYEAALKEWDIDGFKLDFVDDFVVIPPEQIGVKEGMDYADMLHATDALFSECQQRLNGIKQDVLIEFRQTFNGPVIRHYGNMLRSVDSPIDSDENRVRIANLRLLAGDTAVHSDMLMWHYNDTVQSAAMQLANVFFSVPRISMRLSELRNDHKQMLGFYMSLWNKWREVLLSGVFSAHLPRARFVQLCAKLESCFAAGVHAESIVDIPDKCEEAIIINACYSAEILIRAPQPYRALQYSCIGEMKKAHMLCKGFHVLEAEPADVFLLTAEEETQGS